MKQINTLILFLMPFMVLGQIDITGRVIPWKTIDQIESFEILLQLNNDTLLNQEFQTSAVQNPGQYPIDLFHVKSDQMHGTLSCIFRCRRAGNKDYWQFEKHQVLQRGTEQYMEIEFHLQEYEGGQEFLEEFVIKKVFPTPTGLSLMPLWKPEMEASPKYLIANTSRFTVYGQSADGYFEGVLYKQNEDGQFKRYYTGGYNLEKNPEGPLFADQEKTSTIRNHALVKNKFKIKEPGVYRYVVRLGFKPYELSTDYGSIPYFSVDYPVNSGTTRRSVKEYFELSEVFQIE